MASHRFTSPEVDGLSCMERGYWEAVQGPGSAATFDPTNRHTVLATDEFSQDKMQVFLAWAALSKTVMVQVWGPVGGDRLMSLEGHRAPVLALSFSSHAKEIASRSSDKTVRLWRLRDGSCGVTFVEHDVGRLDTSSSPQMARRCFRERGTGPSLFVGFDTLLPEGTLNHALPRCRWWEVF
ncbi:hypothetical protein LXA43DRAFT_1181315 [Ganoderma leucocontextum]|nr:hypothetical protein LXA43DRAFT_1181315 [Ganoderma leucocontextum]